MILVRFTGLIHPRAGQWVYDAPIRLSRGDRILVISVQDSAFSVTLQTNDAEDLDRLSEFERADWFNAQWQEASTWIRAALDTLGFHLGAALEVELLNGYVDLPDQPTPRPSWLVWNRLSQSEFSTVEGNRVGPDKITKYLHAAAAVPHVRYALADLRSALLYPDDAAFYAYRAVESIRQCFTDPDDDPQASATKTKTWERLRTTLNVTREELGELAEAAKARRHGAADFLTADDRRKCIRLAREVVARFIDSRPEPQLPTASAEA